MLESKTYLEIYFYAANRVREPSTFFLLINYFLWPPLFAHKPNVNLCFSRLYILKRELLPFDMSKDKDPFNENKPILLCTIKFSSFYKIVLTTCFDLQFYHEKLFYQNCNWSMYLLQRPVFKGWSISFLKIARSA